MSASERGDLESSSDDSDLEEESLTDPTKKKTLTHEKGEDGIDDSSVPIMDERAITDPYERPECAQCDFLPFQCR